MYQQKQKTPPMARTSIQARAEVQAPRVELSAALCHGFNIHFYFIHSPLAYSHSPLTYRSSACFTFCSVFRTLEQKLLLRCHGQSKQCSIAGLHDHDQTIESQAPQGPYCGGCDSNDCAQSNRATATGVKSRSRRDRIERSVSIIEFRTKL